MSVLPTRLPMEQKNHLQVLFARGASGAKRSQFVYELLCGPEPLSVHTKEQG